MQLGPAWYFVRNWRALLYLRMYTYLDHNVRQMSLLSKQEIGGSDDKASYIDICHQIQVLEREVWMANTTLKTSSLSRNFSKSKI